MLLDDFLLLRNEISVSRNVVDLAAALLRFCRKNEQTYLSARQEASFRRSEATIATEAMRCCAQIDSEDLDETARSTILELIQRYEESPRVVVARAVAHALDDQLGPRFLGIFRTTSFRIIGPHDPIPVMQPPLKKLLGKALNTEPSTLEFRVDRLRYLRLAPADFDPFRVELSTAASDHLAPLIEVDGTLFGTALLNDTTNELEWDRHPETESFYAVRPRCPDEQAARIRAVVQEAVARGVTVLVFPELCTDSAGMQILLQSFQNAPETLRLLVAGSHHVERQGSRRNECIAVLRGYSEPLIHWKFAEFSYVDSEGIGWKEGISLIPATIRLHVSAGWSFVTLICKDFLYERARRLLEDLGVRLFLIPCFTPKADAFSAFGTALTQSVQAYIIIANNPRAPSGVSAIFGGPSRKNPLVSVTDPLQPPALCIYDPLKSQTSIVQCHLG